jgi:mono/diheme cytochrome c family protein
MRRRVLNALLLVLFLLLLGANWGLRRGEGRRNLEVFPDMVDAVSAESFAASPLFADGKVLREPPPGTIPRGRPPLHFAATPEDAKRAGRELANPAAANAAALARGETVYQSFCLTCHGGQGKGDGPVAQRGFPAPPSLLAPNALGLADGQMFHILTWGQGNMPSYASQVDREDRWKVILYVRSLQKSNLSARTTSLPAPLLKERGEKNQPDASEPLSFRRGVGVRSRGQSARNSGAQP